MAHVTLKQGDRLLLCSDGLHDYFPAEEEIAQRISEEKPGDALKEMVELAKTRGGHDNITGIAVHVVEVHEGAVPEKVTEDSTQPVDLTGNPFAADEPTQTAAANVLAAVGHPPNLPSLKSTQPMRIVDPTAPTVPPPLKNKTPKDGAAKAEPEAKADGKDDKSEALRDTPAQGTPTTPPTTPPAPIDATADTFDEKLNKKPD
jgi:hypothetical protein